MHTACNGDVRLAYDCVGPATGTPMLLVCGNATQVVHWPEEFLAALVDRGFRVALFDNRDSGRSTHCAHLPPYDLRDMAADARAVLDALGWSSAHVLGVSLGGMIGQVMAVHHPDRVRSLTSIASAPAWSLSLSRPRLRTLLRIIRVASRAGEGRDAAVETTVRIFRLIASTRRYPIDEAWVREVSTRAYDLAHDPGAPKRQQAACKAGGDRRAELAGVTAPTLVVHGEDDPLQSVRAGRATADAIPGARLLVLPGVAHSLPPAGLWPQVLDELCAVAARAPGPGA